MADSGGPVDLHSKLQAAGWDIGLPAVQAWARRGSIPGEWVAVILHLHGENPKGWLLEEDIF